MVELLLVKTFFSSHSDCLPDHFNHVVALSISFEHVVDFWLGHNKLNLAEKVFPHRCISAVKAFDGLHISSDKLVK